MIYLMKNSMDPKKETDQFIIADALAYGWCLKERGDSYNGYHTDLDAPSHFACNTWSALWEKIIYNNKYIYVPDYIRNVNIRRTGNL